MSKKMEEREELSVKWKNIKNEFPVITKGLFQPDLTAVIQSFDQTLQSWDKTEDSEKKLEDVLSGLATNLAKASGSMGSLRDTRDKTDKEEADLIKKTGETLNSFIGKKDLEMVDGQIFSALDAYANAMQTAFTTHNSLSDQISKHGAQMVAVAKKARDDYKSKSDAITAAL